PVLEPHVRVAIHVEEDVGGVVAPDRLEGRPVEGGVGAEVAVVGREDRLVIGVGAAVEANGARHAARLALIPSSENAPTPSGSASSLVLWSTCPAVAAVPRGRGTRTSPD